MRLPGSRKVTLVKDPGTDHEVREEVIGAIQPKKGFFDVTTPIMMGDVIEDVDPRSAGGVLRYSVAEVEIFQGHGPRDHIEVTWGKQPTAPRPQPKPLSTGGLHPRVFEVAGGLFGDGHFAQAVFDAMKAVEHRLRDMSGVDETGQKLVGRVLGGPSPKFRLTGRDGKLGQDEHEGRTLIFLGSMQAIRNIAAHDLPDLDQAMTMEHLAVASLLMRWLDEASPTEPESARIDSSK